MELRSALAAFDENRLPSRPLARCLLLERPRRNEQAMKGPYAYPLPGPGPFRVEHLRPGDPYELDDGHVIVSEPSGPRHAQKNMLGATLLDSDPAVEAAGVDVGYALSERTMRAPDVAIGPMPEQSGFMVGVPALALEYVETHASEADLERKIAALVAAGTKVVWVVRLGGDRQVEVHRSGEARTVHRRGDTLHAPGILRNPVPVDALYDRALAHRVVLRNLLQREGYTDLDAIRTEGIALGRLAQARTALRHVLAARDLTITTEDEARIDASIDAATLDRWLRAAALATSAKDVFDVKR